jgi:hypothetical protein
MRMMMMRMMKMMKMMMMTNYYLLSLLMSHQKKPLLEDKIEGTKPT